jgi:hypothetical protein
MTSTAAKYSSIVGRWRGFRAQGDSPTAGEAPSRYSYLSQVLRLAPVARIGQARPVCALEGRRVSPRNALSTPDAQESLREGSGICRAEDPPITARPVS